MVKPNDWMSDALPSMDCPAAPCIDDFEYYFGTCLQRLAETYPFISESGLQVHGAPLNVVIGD